MRAVFVALALVILLGNLLPLQTLTRGWAGPDLLFGFALAWSVRRPEYVPVPLLAAVFFLADLLLSRPPGLGAALMLMACFDLQTRMLRLRDAGFAAEWGRAAVLIIATAVANRVALAIFFVPAPSLILATFQTIATAAVYPLIVGVSALVFGVRLSAPGDIDKLGHRL
ncbi:rod shape-determining protein MreD [Aliishimia ponticola]|uniref:Rod shape-determining protein MreD n=2 Tax=Aliishimia ponticola TaxID=2499833 RepID=A0A4S4NBP4_9RHOB|nr:rod shape-determining protein MreD [Aliishimia ponticola]